MFLVSGEESVEVVYKRFTDTAFSQASLSRTKVCERF